jgi:ABC-type uncharacterized transport system auxiliary subunit
MKHLRSLVLVTLACALAGCVGSVLPKATQRAAYTLSEPIPLEARVQLPGALLVELPRALPPLDGNDLVVVRSNGEVQLLTEVRWIAPIPELLQQSLARQLEAAGSADVVSQSPQAHALPLRLTSELQAFQLRERENGELVIHARLSVRLTCAADSRVIAVSTTVAADDQVVAAEPEAGVAALRAAATELGRKLVAWLDQVDASSCVVP